MRAADILFWPPSVDFRTIIMQFFAEITSTLQKVFSAKKHVKFKFFNSILYFNELTENISLWSKVLCVGKLTFMAEIIFRKNAASIYGFVCFVSVSKKNSRPLLSKVGG